VDNLFSLAPSNSGVGEIALLDAPNVRYFPVSTLKPLGDSDAKLTGNSADSIFELAEGIKRNSSFWRRPLGHAGLGPRK
jgi:hypothetical protein